MELPLAAQCTRKRRRSKIIKRYFKHEYDHELFKIHYENIKNSELSIKVNIPAVIIKQIAEFANGYIVSCANENCNKYNQEQSKLQSEFDPLGFGMTVNKWYCKICQYKLKYFDCCDVWQINELCDECGMDHKDIELYNQIESVD
eukprot:21265_1